MKKIILASKSPRRSELLNAIGLKFEVMLSNIDENEVSNNIEELVKKLSFKKASAVASKINENYLIIGADTLVFKDRVFGKPNNEEEAFLMLKSLQGCWHQVLTGLTLIDTSTSTILTEVETTNVKFLSMDDKKIQSYIKTKEPMDKAGAYGIQGIGATLIEKIDGCYFNVVGLPLAKLSLMLEKFSIFIL